MEKETATTLALSTYAKQLDEIKHLIDNSIYPRAITRCYQLIDLVKEVRSHSTEAVSILSEHLALAYKLLQNSYFNWLLRDPNQFCQNQKAKKDLLKILSESATMDCFTNMEKQHCQFLAYIIELLFNHSIERNYLQKVRMTFCDLYEDFVQHNQKFSQALVLLGLALIAAYERDLSSTYQGLNHAKRAYPPLHLLIRAIEYQLPHTLSLKDKEQALLINPLAKFKLTEIASSLRLRP